MAEESLWVRVNRATPYPKTFWNLSTYLEKAAGAKERVFQLTYFSFVENRKKFSHIEKLKYKTFTSKKKKNKICSNIKYFVETCNKEIFSTLRHQKA